MWNDTNTCGDKALSSMQTFLWIQCFQEEEEDVEHDRNSGWQTTFNSEMVGKVHNLLAREQRMTYRMKPSELNFNKEFVWSVITKNSHKKQNCVKVWWLELQMTGCLHTHTTHPHPPDLNPLTGSKTLLFLLLNLKWTGHQCNTITGIPENVTTTEYHQCRHIFKVFTKFIQLQQQEHLVPWGMFWQK